MRTKLGKTVACLQVSLLLGVTVSLGCNKGPNLAGANGEVTFNGKPIDVGTIEFIPIADTQGPSNGGAIQGGHYEILQKKGLRVGGKYRVAIISMRDTGRKTRNLSMHPDDPLLPVFENFIPARYNTESTLEVSVSDNSSQEFNFSLEAK